MKISPSNDSEWRRQNGDYTYRINYDLNNNSVVVDLGARHGNWCSLIRNKYNSKIYCFEVVPQFCNELVNSGYKTFCIAVSDKKEKVKSIVYDYFCWICEETLVSLIWSV